MDMSETTNTTARKIEALGKRQRNVLSALARHGRWNGSGWVWTNYSTTKLVLDSLRKHGLVEIVEVTTGTDSRTTGEFRPTREVEIHFTGGHRLWS
jgi:hypothetical protein